MVSEARETMEKRGVSVRVGEKRIEGAREKKVGALGSPDRNTLGEKMRAYVSGLAFRQC